jgi:serine/threonine-protein kinase
VFRARYMPQDEDGPRLPLERGDVVVLKVMRKQMDLAADEAEAFSREAEILVTLDHPGIVSALTRGVHAGRVWLALEYVEGEDVANVLSAFSHAELRMRPDVAAVLIADLASALGAAHALADPRGRRQGLVHRDLAPRNILIDVGGNVRLFDFGSALIAQAPAPSDKNPVGTPGYLAPEQARAYLDGTFAPLTAAVDTYAVGVLFFELLTGRRAFNFGNLPDDKVLELHARGERPRWPSRIAIPREYTDVVDILVAPDPSERPADGGALYHLVAPLARDLDAGRHALGVVARDLVLSNRDRPPPLYVR